MEDMALVDHYTKSLPVDVFALAKALTISVKQQTMTSSGTMTKVGKQWMVFINADDSPARQRFTLAHMIGHYMLHRDLMAKGIHVDYLYGEKPAKPATAITAEHEIQANKMATQILLPLFQMRVHEEKSDDELAALFQVSPASIQIRRQLLKS